MAPTIMPIMLLYTSIWLSMVLNSVSGSPCPTLPSLRPNSLRFSCGTGEGPVVGVCALQQLLCDQLLKQGLESLFLTTVSREYTF